MSEASEHIQCFRGSLDAPVSIMGHTPLLEIHSFFPNRTNVQFFKVLDQSNIRIEIWERGASYTLASGSSSSAAATVVRKLGLCDSQISVHMPGGEISISIDEESSASSWLDR